MEPQQKIEWGDLRVFLQVARAGQMAVASRSLALDHSTISRGIACLEEHMGVSLFDRAGRRLNLTDEGAKLLAAAEKLESIIIRDVLSLGESHQEICGRVRIGTSEGFGAHYLASRIPKLVDTFPGLEVEPIAIPKCYSLGMREADLVITMERPKRGDIHFKKLSAIHSLSTLRMSIFDPANVRARSKICPIIAGAATSANFSTLLNSTC